MPIFITIFLHYHAREFTLKLVQQFFFSILVLLALFPVWVSAQPDAGTLRQQIEEDILPTPLRETVPAKPAEPEPLKTPQGVTVTVKAFRFVGNTLLTDEQLADVVASYLNRALDLNALNAAASAVAKAYRETGWIVRAYLPKQEIQDGIVTIQIVEAVFGKVDTEGVELQRLTADTAVNMIESVQPRGDKLSSHNLDRALLLLDDLPGISATGTLRAGKQQGETDLLLKLADDPLLHMEAGADNNGSRATGSERLLANLTANSPLRLGDLVRTNYLHSKGSDYLRAAYSLPVGFDGWRVGVNGSILYYDLVAPEFLSLNGEGSSDSVGLEASYPIIRTRPRNLYLQLNYDRKHFDNKANGETSSKYQVNTTSIGLVGNLFDKLGGGGANTASLKYSYGRLDLSGSPTQEADALTTRSEGHYAKWRYALSRQQVMTDTLSFYAAFSGQWSHDNLDSSEKFYLGGASGVRAYPTSEAGGSQGHMLNLELRRKLPQGFTLVPFYDWGWVKVNSNNDFNGAAASNTIVLKGAGLAVNWQGDTGISARLTWARRISDNPNLTTAGKDQDGSYIKNRVWANVMVPF